MLTVDMAGTSRLTRWLAGGQVFQLRVPVNAAFKITAYPPSNDRLISTSRLEPEKRVDLLMLAAVRSDRPLRIIGSGSEEARLRLLAESYEAADIAFEGQLDPPDVARFYADGGTFVLAGSAEGYPLSCVEALSAGLVAIGVRGPGLHQLEPYGLLLKDSIDGVVEALSVTLPRPDFPRVYADHTPSVTADAYWGTILRTWKST
jgi:glycosyltransferase involved in cell wall biosynthesis